MVHRCYPLITLPCTCLARCEAECSNIPRFRDRRAHAARDAGYQCELCGGSAGVLALSRQGVSTMEAAQERGALIVTLDEVVPPALLARLVFFPGDSFERPAEVCASCSPLQY
jgi:hypothetical protein